MLGKFAHRIVVRSLDAVVARGRRSSSRPVRAVAGAIDRSRRIVGLHRVPVSAPLPPWPDRVPDPPMWDSERERLEKWYAQMGYGRLGPGAVPVPDAGGDGSQPGATEAAAGGGAPRPDASGGHEGAGAPEASRAPAGARREGAPVRLPVVGGPPERSPFEDAPLPGDGPVAGGARLTGEALVAAVREVLDACRPLVAADGGDIELLDVRDDVVHLRLTGNCVGCPSARATLRQGIERRLKAALPQIRGIEAPGLGPGDA